MSEGELKDRLTKLELEVGALKEAVTVLNDTKARIVWGAGIVGTCLTVFLGYSFFDIPRRVSKAVNSKLAEKAIDQMVDHTKRMEQSASDSLSAIDKSTKSAGESADKLQSLWSTSEGLVSALRRDVADCSQRLKDTDSGWQKSMRDVNSRLRLESFSWDMQPNGSVSVGFPFPVKHAWLEVLPSQPPEIEFGTPYRMVAGVTTQTAGMAANQVVKIVGKGEPSTRVNKYRVWASGF